MSSNYFKKINLIALSVILFGVIPYYFLNYKDNNLNTSEDFLVRLENNVINQSNKGLFIDSKKDSKLELPELYLIQGNSLVASCPSGTITPQILGSLGVENNSIIRKEIIEYIVEPSDSLSVIADKFDISLNTLLLTNDLNNNSIINAGKKLIILPVSGILYLVRSGDTLSDIAKKYKGSEREIADFNELSEEKQIFIGDLLIIPGGKMPSVSKKYYTAAVLPNSYFIFPTQGKITQGLHWYNAIDVANNCGTPILAAAGGEVQKIGYKTWPAGNFVRILHPNGIVTLYGHLSKILVKTGERVSQGQIIAYMGSTGLSTGCHLHFDVRGAKNPLAKYSLGSQISWK